MDDDATPAVLRLNTQLGPLPEASTRTDRHIDGYGVPAFTEDDMRAYAAQEVAAERERCDVLTDDMLRYAMAAMGTGSPREADNLRTFWRFAIEARNTKA